MKSPKHEAKNLSLRKALRPVAEDILDAHAGGAGIWGCCMWVDGEWHFPVNPLRCGDPEICLPR